MTHPLRLYVPGMSLHVIRRGNNRCAVFIDDSDRHRFLRDVEHAADDHQVSVHGFVLMTTHYHLLVTPHEQRSLQGMMKSIGEQYVRYFNDRHQRIGTLWAGRYRGLLIEDERRWLTCLRYIEQNPWRAKMVDVPEAYRWSSCRVHAFGERLDWLVPHPLYLALGATPEERQAAYRAILSEPLSSEELVYQRVGRAQ